MIQKKATDTSVAFYIYINLRFSIDKHSFYGIIYYKDVAIQQIILGENERGYLR